MSNLKEKAMAAIAEVEEWKAAGENWPQWNLRYIAFEKEATPAKVLDLISENERLGRNRDMWKDQVERQAGELASLRKALADGREALGREYWDQYAGLDETRDILDAALDKGEQP